MIHAPAFWDRDGVAARLLSPAGALFAAATARRVARPGWTAPVPVLCCGGATVGGAGKTTVALDLTRRLRARGIAAHCLTRGYGGRAGRGRDGRALRVEPDRHPAALVGDEALLLAQAAPTWVAADREAGARAAVAAGAQALVMDDGLQNPGLRKTVSLLVVDGGGGFGNGRVMPAGPLREPAAAAASRCRAAVLVGPDLAGAAGMLPRGLPVLRTALAPGLDLGGVRAYALSGIARPGKFHASLREAGAEVVGAASFPDHHPFTAAELERALDRAAALGAVAVTTAKDAVRMPPALGARFRVLPIRLAWEDPDAVEALLREAVP